MGIALNVTIIHYPIFLWPLKPKFTLKINYNNSASQRQRFGLKVLKINIVDCFLWHSTRGALVLKIDIPFFLQ